MRRVFISLVGLVSVTYFLLSGAGSASASVFSVRTDAEDLHFQKVKGYDRVDMVDARLVADAGNPLLPVKFVQVAIPTEMEAAEVRVVSYKFEELPCSFNIWPSQPCQPLSTLPLKADQIRFVPPNAAVYNLSSEYPGRLAQLTNNGFLAGHHIAGVALYPLQYIPAEGKLILYTEIEFELVFRPISRLPVSVNRRSQKTAEFYSDMAGNVVINPESVVPLIRGLFAKGDEIDFLIITADSLVSVFEQLADWKLQKGISTRIETVSVVTSNYSGDDTQEKIRKCILDYYQNHGTKWVLLGGDAEIIPLRYTFLFETGYEDKWLDTIPTDHYYCDLEGTWDDNGNGVYGEYPDNVDMYPEVFVGRAPSVDSSEAQAFVNKCLTYEFDPPVTDYQKKILYVASVIWKDLWTDGADLKQFIDNTYAPADRDTTKLYEGWGTLDRDTFEVAVNAGQHLINHHGHGHVTGIQLADEWWYASDNWAFHNDTSFSLFYSLSCLSACVDSECFAESFIHNDSGGVFAFCGNTRFGLGKWGFALEGPSPEYDKEFFRALWQDSILQLGHTFGDAKIAMIPLANNPDTTYNDQAGMYYRWPMFALILLGDPTLQLWSEEPDSLEISHKSTLYTGEVYLKVNVNEDDALVTCIMDDQILGSAYSVGGTAVVYFDSPPSTEGTMHVTATKPDWVPAYSTLDVEDVAASSYLVYYSHTAIDSGTNSNGGINPGDTVYMKVTLKNLGPLQPLSVKGSLATADTFISMIDDSGSWGGMGSKGRTMSQDDYFVFACASSCPDGHLVGLEIEWKVGVGTWQDSVFQMMLVPDFTVDTDPDTAYVRIEDSTDVSVTLTSVAGFNSQVNIFAWGLPPGVEGRWIPDSLVTPTDTRTLRLVADSTATECSKICSLYAIGGGTYHIHEFRVTVLPEPHEGQIWYVSTSGSDDYCDGSEGCPFRTIQKGIDTASSSHTVVVKRGAYLETIDFKGKGILVTSAVMDDSLWWTVDSTIINADDSGSVVTFNSGETNSSILRGFTLRNGKATDGAGIYCYNSSPTIIMNKLMDNACTGKGGGIYCYNSDTSMAAIKIQKNVIHHCTGMGGIYLGGGNDAQLVNNTIAHNDTGVYIDSCAVTVKNCILWGNYGCEIWIDTTVSSLTITYSDVDTTSGEGYCGIDDQTGSNGNIYAWPEFRDTLLATGDYRFEDSTSPCVNRGDPNDTDIPRWGGYRIDMGGIEFPVKYHPGDVQSDWAINDGDVFYLINYLYNSGPNCYPPPAGDANCDEIVNAGDIVYLQNYLYRGGPAPPESCDQKCGRYAGGDLDPYKGKAPAKAMLATPIVSDQGIFEAAVVARSDVDLAAIELHVNYDPVQITLSEASLTTRTEGLQIYSWSKDGIQKIGVLDVQARNCVAPGVGSVVVIRGTGKDLSSLHLARAVLVDNGAYEIPVQIVSQIEETENLVRAEKANLPKAFSLSQNQPNPFNPDTKISYALPKECHVTLTVYNVLGQKVMTLVDEPKVAGWHEVIWHGRDCGGNDLSSGIYFYRLSADDFAQSKKMLLLK